MIGWLEMLNVGGDFCIVPSSISQFFGKQRKHHNVKYWPACPLQSISQFSDK